VLATLQMPDRLGYSSDTLLPPSCIRLATLQIRLRENMGLPSPEAFPGQSTYFSILFFIFFVAWGGRTGTTLAGRKILYAYILHDLARPTECYVGLFPKGTYPLKNSLEPPPWPTGLPYPERSVGSGTVRLSLDRPTPPADPTLKSGRVPTSQLCRRKASVWD
jgi:hypothetical protein